MVPAQGQGRVPAQIQLPPAVSAVLVTALLTSTSRGLDVNATVLGMLTMPSNK